PPARAISADGQSAAVIMVRSNGSTDPVQLTLAAPPGFSGPVGSLAQYNPNFLDGSSGRTSGQLSIPTLPPASCDSGGNCIFLALLWAPTSMSGSPTSQPLSITATQDGVQIQATIQLQPPPLVLVHGLWSSAAEA